MRRPNAEFSLGRQGVEAPAERRGSESPYPRADVVGEERQEALAGRIRTAREPGQLEAQASGLPATSSLDSEVFSESGPEGLAMSDRADNPGLATEVRFREQQAQVGGRAAQALFAYGRERDDGHLEASERSLRAVTGAAVPVVGERTETVVEEAGNRSSASSALSPLPVGSPPAAAARELTAADEAVIRDLQRMERELLNREMKQAGAGGGVTGPGRHVVETGPDGERYVTDGASSPVIVAGGTPEQELRRARAVQRAALAPSRPSAWDLAVASEAARIERAAEEEIRLEQQDASVEAELEAPTLETLVADQLMAAKRRSELAEQDRESTSRRQELQDQIKVAVVEDRTVPNAEVVALKRQVAIDAYLSQL